MASNSPQEDQTTRRTTVSIVGNSVGFKLFFNERDSDVSIKVEHEDGNAKFPGHTLILCTMSEVFRTMLQVDMLEKHTKTITIKDSNPHAIKQFLKYLYMGVVEFIDYNEAISLLKVAHKYSVPALINLCETYLKANILFNNVCLLYEIARTYSLELLEKESEDFILDAGFIVSATHGFFNLKPSSIDKFLSNPFFNIENEGCVLTSLREWAVTECTRKCISLTSSNVIEIMKPFLKFIEWGLIPDCNRTFIPTALVQRFRNRPVIYRRPFHTPASLQYRMNYVKCSVELGAFHQESYFSQRSLPCLKFSVDNHIFLAGFRIVGLFPRYPGNSSAPNFLVIRKDDNDNFYMQLNLMSLPWMRGEVVGQHVWQEMTAYIPYPVRVNPYSTYTLSLRSSRSVRSDRCVKWPITRLDTEPISTNLGAISFHSHDNSFAITQLFILPAPPLRKICNIDDC